MTFTQTQLDEFKVNLQEAKSKIEETLVSLKSQDPFSDPDRLNDNAASDTEASEESNHDRVEALEKELTHKLEAIVMALEHIDEGTYGVCQNCGNTIEENRLKIQPTAQFCATCEHSK